MTITIKESTADTIVRSHNATSTKSLSDDKAAPVQEHEVASFKPGRGFYLAFLSLTVFTLMVALDGTSLSVVLPVISKALKGSALEAFWAGTRFTLASAVFQPTFAQFSSVFGRVFTVIGAMVSFLACARGIIWWFMLYYEPVYFEAAKGYSPVMAGVALFPEIFAFVPLAIIVALAITKPGCFRWSIWSG